MGGTEERGGREEGKEEGERGGEVRRSQMPPNPGQSRLYRYYNHSKPAGATNVIFSDS